MNRRMPEMPAVAPGRRSADGGWERETLEKLLFATLRSSVRRRRWRMFMPLAVAGGDRRGRSGISSMRKAVRAVNSTPHTAVIEIRGEIASGA